MQTFYYYSTVLELLQTIIIVGGGLATAILAMWGLWSKIIKPWFKESRQKRAEFAKAIGHIESISEKLEKVSKELQPNGGGSIKDQVKQIANDIKIIRVEKDATFYLSKEPSFKSDGKGHYTSVNYSLAQLIGVSESELIGLGWLNYIALEDKDRIWGEWENIIESGKEISLFYVIRNPTTMKVIPVKCRAVINRDKEKIISVIGTIEPTEKNITKN
jgi:PAS domain S-box-containing protein